MENWPPLNPADTRPLNHQIAAVIREAIESGELEPGARVPGENTIMERYGVARWTAREALALLANLGLITKVPKVGTFVRSERRLERKPRRYRRLRNTAPFASEVRAAGMNPNIEARSEAVEPPADIRERLQLEGGERTMRTVYRFLADGKPVQSSVSYEPLSITAGTPVEIPEEGPYAGLGVIARLDAIDVKITHVSEDVSVRPPTPEESSSLAIPSGVHVFEIWRTFKTDARPVEVAKIVIPGDRYSLSYQFSVPDEFGDDPITE